MIMSIKIAADDRDSFVQALEDFMLDVKNKNEGSNFFTGKTCNRPYELDFDLTTGESVFENSDTLTFMPGSTYVSMVE